MRKIDGVAISSDKEKKNGTILLDDGMDQNELILKQVIRHMTIEGYELRLEDLRARKTIQKSHQILICQLDPMETRSK